MATANNNNNMDTEFSAASALAGLAQEHSMEEQQDHEEEKEFHIPQRFTKSGRKRAVPFTIKLMKVLSDKKNAHIITWMPSGKSFNILKPKAFVADILPEHFKTAKYSSFTRKLHRWGFMRHYRGEEAGAFYHKDFQRGRLDLVEQMTCHKAEPPKSTPVITAAAAALESQRQQMAALLLQKQAGLFKNAATIPTMPTTMPYRAMAPEGQSLPGAPPKNIHGARTA